MEEGRVEGSKGDKRERHSRNGEFAFDVDRRRGN